MSLAGEANMFLIDSPHDLHGSPRHAVILLTHAESSVEANLAFRWLAVRLHTLLHPLKGLKSLKLSAVVLF